MARAAVVGALRDKLDDLGSWAGETHIQKAAFFLQEAAFVPLEYDFVLYKHGPFSFSLRDDLNEFRADGLLELRPQSAPYGPRLATTSQGRALQERFPKTLSRYRSGIERVAGFINSRPVSELERLGTALLLLKKSPDWSNEELAMEMCRLKPHVREPKALSAVSEVREFLEGASSMKS